MQNEKIVDSQLSARRKILGAVGILAVAPLFKWLSFSKKKTAIDCGPVAKSNKVTFLTQDGKLVEVDESQIKLIQKKISNTELQNWIKKS